MPMKPYHKNRGVKMMLCIRTDLKMQKGKMCAQCGHATLGLYKQVMKKKKCEKMLEAWEANGTKKIAAKLKDEAAMNLLISKATDAGIEFYTDQLRLRFLLANIMSNALKFNKEGRKHCVNINAHSNAQQVLIEISDNGIGIAPEHYHKVFQLFFKSNHVRSGSGLGLYIAKEATEKLSGTLDFESNESGTTFKIVLKNFKPDLITQSEEKI